MDFENDEPVEDAGLSTLLLGYRVSERWTLEAGLSFLPELKDNPTRDWRTGNQVSRLEPAAGVDETDAWRFALDALFHLAPSGRLDPYLSAGVGATRFSDPLDDTELECSAQLGAGAFYTFAPGWSLRADARVLMVGEDTEFNAVTGLGLCRSFGGAASRRTASRPVDTDWDALTDDAEVHEYGTDPLKRDTDGGGVGDGHEVLVDRTDARQSADDLKLIEPHIEYETGRWEIRPEYFSELNVIGKLLRDTPAATARIEAHVAPGADQSPREANRLTTKRAQAVQQYLQEKWQIEASRMKAVGYGSTWPRAAEVPESGPSRNNRTEVYIRVP